MTYQTHLSLRKRVVLMGIFFVMLTLLAACASDAPDNSKTYESKPSSANISIRWYQTVFDQGESRYYPMANLDCQGSGVEQVTCSVYDANGTRLVTGGAWPCTDGGARLLGIPSGPGRIFVVLAEDADGNICYQGETDDILIEPDKIAQVTLNALPFQPVLRSPVGGVEVDPAGFSFEWEDLPNAHQYLILVSEDQNFVASVIHQTTVTTQFTPPDLLPSIEYFWRVHALDRFTNSGVASETARFVTSACTYAISSDGADFDEQGGIGGFDVSASSDDCSWIAVSGADWIEITAGEEGRGDGSVAYAVAANTNSAERTGAIIAGGRIYTITQQGVDCAYQIAPARREIEAVGGSGNIQVTATAADCPWEAVSNVGWISITGSASGTGSLVVTYMVSANGTVQERTGIITIAGQQHTVHQQQADIPEPCTYDIAPAREEFEASGGPGTVRVTTSADDCAWTAASNVDWVTLGASVSGTGSGAVNYTVSVNNTSQARDGVITIAGQHHAVHQEAPPPEICTYDILPDSHEFDAQGGDFNVSVIASAEDCPWEAAVTDDDDLSWITIVDPASGSGIGTGDVVYGVSSTEEERSGEITIAGEIHAVHQSAPDLQDECTYDIYPLEHSFDSDGGGNSFTVTTPRPDCRWDASTSDDWIYNITRSGSVVVYSVESWSEASTRTGYIDITFFGGQGAHTVTQTGTTTTSTLTWIPTSTSP